jgi:hypothetical protein
VGSIYLPDWHLHAVCEIIIKARKTGPLKLGDVFNALNTVKEDRYEHVGQLHALKLADALRTVLTASELMQLCSQTADQIRWDASSTVGALEEVVRKCRMAIHSTDQENVGVADIASEKKGWDQSQLIVMAVVAQALEWVVNPPADSLPHMIS